MTYNVFGGMLNLAQSTMIVVSGLQAEADYGGTVRPLKPSSSGYLTSASECMLRAAKMEDVVTERAAFSGQAMTEGLFVYSCESLC